MFKYILVEEKISKREEHKVDFCYNGHSIFESANYQDLPSDYIYRIVSVNAYNGKYLNYVDFTFINKKIEKIFNLTPFYYQTGSIQVDLDKQIIAISAHSGAFHGTLKVRLYRIE